MQDLERQVDAIVAAGIEPKHSYPDKKSGSTLDRPGLAGCCGIPAMATRSFFTRWIDSAARPRHLNIIHDVAGDGRGCSRHMGMSSRRRPSDTVLARDP
jgi:hypothetical protein